MWKPGNSLPSLRGMTNSNKTSLHVGEKDSFQNTLRSEKNKIMVIGLLWHPKARPAVLARECSNLSDRTNSSQNFLNYSRMLSDVLDRKQQARICIQDIVSEFQVHSLREDMVLY
jgi:hypothetical protein